MANPFSTTEKKFSIGVPFYGKNYADFEKFFRVMDEGDYKNFEVVVTFDGENKKGVKALLKEIAKYPEMEIKYQTIEHGGCTVARNACVDMFTGDYYCFMGSDYYLYPETLRLWANAFDEHKEINRIWGLYDIVQDGQTQYTIGQIPYFEGKVWYEAVKYSPYIDAGFPIRAEYFSPWTPGIVSLNDWDWSLTHLEKTNFKGDDHLYVPQAFYAAEAPRPGGLSNDSATNWKMRKKMVQDRHGLKPSDICVTSLGAMNHAIPTAKMLGADVLTMPSFKPNDYKMIYLLGFYTREDPQQPGFVTKTHMDIFDAPDKINVIHWIGTDIWDLRRHNSFDKLKELREWFKKKKIIHLCEAEFTRKELAELGIDAKVVPLPPGKLYNPMPLPEQFTVGVYLPGRDLYNEAKVMDVVRSMPDVSFEFFGDKDRALQKGDNWLHLGFVDFDEFMPRWSCNLRITNHDGLPLTPLQFLTAGRNVVTNVPVKGAIELKWGKDAYGIDNLREQTVKAIRQAQEKPLDLKYAKYWTKELDKEKFVKAIRGLK